jgi:hypothetical protein
MSQPFHKHHASEKLAPLVREIGRAKNRCRRALAKKIQPNFLQPLVGEMDSALCNHRLHLLPAILKPRYEP